MQVKDGRNRAPDGKKQGIMRGRGSPGFAF